MREKGKTIPNEIIFKQLNMPPSKRYDRHDFAQPANKREYVGEILGQERYGEAAKAGS